MTWLLFISFVLALLITYVNGRLGISYEEIDAALDEILATNTVGDVLRDLKRNQPLSAREIQERMWQIRRETLILALASEGISAHLMLLVFNLVFGLLWLKSHVLPNARDLRWLVGGEMFVLCQVEDR